MSFFELPIPPPPGAACGEISENEAKRGSDTHNASDESRLSQAASHPALRGGRETTAGGSRTQTSIAEVAGKEATATSRDGSKKEMMVLNDYSPNYVCSDKSRKYQQHSVRTLEMKLFSEREDSEIRSRRLPTLRKAQCQDH